MIGDDMHNPSESSAPVVFDWQHFREITSGDIMVERDLITMFLASSRQDIAALESNMSDHCFEAWIDVAHKIYGMAANLGANALAEACDQAQGLSVSDMEAIHVWHDTILKRCSHVHEQLQHLAAP